MNITLEMEKALVEANEREKEFWMRHGVFEQIRMRETGAATRAHKAWVKAVEFEYKNQPPESKGRVHLDTPIARKAFILGYFTASKIDNERENETDGA